MGKFKTILGIVVGFGVGAIADSAIKANMPGKAGFLKKICLCIGAYALSWFVADKVADFVDKKVDDTVKETKKLVENIKIEVQKQTVVEGEGV